MNEDEQEKKLEEELREGLNEDAQEDTQTGDEPTLVIEKPVVEAPVHPNTGGTLVLQWLSYAFWGWLVGALIWLISLTLSNALVGTDTSLMIPYALAASIVLLPVAFFTDFVYRKREPVKKHGAAMVIMIIHAVLFALITIGTIIGAVFIAINMVINGSLTYNNYDAVVLYATLFAGIAFGVTFLRVLNPFRSKRFAKIFGFGMLTLAIGLLVWAFVGPTVNAISRRDDRLIESNLSVLANSISSYVGLNGKLPDSLTDLTIESDDAKLLITKDLVDYKAEGKTATTKTDYGYDVYHYQLCVTYEHSAEYNYGGGYVTPNYGVDSTSSSDYQTYPNTYNHKTGDVCYKLEASNYKSGYEIPVSIEGSVDQ